jgi:Shikimate 5-dehydrogenase
MKEKQYGLLGKALKHSYSKEIHESFGKYNYELFQVEPEDLGSFLIKEELAGLNVTIPYKKEVIKYCETLSEAAVEIGAVNTMVRQQNGAWAGYNTDHAGFLYLLEQAKITLKNKKVLIFGSGGTFLTASYAARKEGASEIVCISRTGENNYENLHLHKDAQILINTTPVGMFPHIDKEVASINEFPLCEGVIDVIYNPLRTRLVLQAKEKGIPAIGGLGMLVKQAVQAYSLFMGEGLPKETTREILKELYKQKENIVLTGMPGCGKTAIGKLLAESMQREFIDTDEMIFKETGRTAEELINTEGEHYFRQYEKEIVKKVSVQTGIVIATGGGAVLDEENVTTLKQNGRVYFIERDIEKLAVLGRPLSKNIQQLYIERCEIYQETADVKIENNSEIQQTVQYILKEIEK